MGSNSSTLVISIAIGILLLLILLLLLSYNSKAKSDKIERFEDNEDDEVEQISPVDGFYGGSAGFKNYEHFNHSRMDRFENKRKTAEPFNGLTSSTSSSNSSGQEGFSNMEGAPLGNSYVLSDKYNEASSCYKRDRLTASDLLPSDASSKWAQINPSSSGDLSDQNFLTAGYHIGMNTQGTSMRNANLQLRSEIPNPQVAVSPWLISTIEPDVRAVSFEIGSAPQTPPS